MLKYLLNKNFTQWEKRYRMGSEAYHAYVDQLEDYTIMLMKQLMLENEDWDIRTLCKQWNMDYDEIAKCRKNGLEFYRKGRDYYYTPEARRAFIEKRKNK